MTKRLEELFDLASSDDNDLTQPIFEHAREITQEAVSNLEKIDNALPQVKGLEASDQEMDELAELATATYKDLVDLGMQVESRFSSEVFQAASSFLGHAITAKTAKINKKLKQLDLQLKKAQLDMKIAAKNEDVESTPIGEGQQLDRNQLLKLLNNKNNDQ
jgi:CRISPR/Cas system CMR-associated protein Cmr5 small subunit